MVGVAEGRGHHWVICSDRYLISISSKPKLFWEEIKKRLRASRPVEQNSVSEYKATAEGFPLRFTVTEQNWA